MEKDEIPECLPEGGLAEDQHDLTCRFQDELAELCRRYRGGLTPKDYQWSLLTALFQQLHLFSHEHFREQGWDVCGHGDEGG